MADAQSLALLLQSVGPSGDFERARRRSHARGFSVDRDGCMLGGLPGRALGAQNEREGEQTTEEGRGARDRGRAHARARTCAHG